MVMRLCCWLAAAAGCWLLAAGCAAEPTRLAANQQRQPLSVSTLLHLQSSYKVDKWVRKMCKVRAACCAVLLCLACCPAHIRLLRVPPPAAAAAARTAAAVPPERRRCVLLLLPCSLLVSCKLFLLQSGDYQIRL